MRFTPRIKYSYLTDFIGTVGIRKEVAQRVIVRRVHERRATLNHVSRCRSWVASTSTLPLGLRAVRSLVTQAPAIKTLEVVGRSPYRLGVYRSWSSTGEHISGSGHRWCMSGLLTRLVLLSLTQLRLPSLLASSCHTQRGVVSGPGHAGASISR